MEMQPADSVMKDQTNIYFSTNSWIYFAESVILTDGTTVVKVSLNGEFWEVRQVSPEVRRIDGNIDFIEEVWDNAINGLGLELQS